MKNFAKLFSVLAVILATAFPAAAQFADQATYIAAPGGTANAITLAVDNWNINRAGVPIRFLPAAANTAATTVVVNGVGGAIAIKKPTGNGLVALSGGELTTTEIAEITFDGTQWQLGSAIPNPAEPQGYLTPCQVSSPSPVAGCTAGSPYITGNVTSATTLYYEGVKGNLIPIFNGGRFIPTAVTESQMTLILSSTANTANNLYDVCVYNNAGTPAIGTMPAWSNAGAGTSARSAAIGIVQGIWLNSSTVTVTNNNVGVSVAANRCTVVATILIDSVNGQASFTTTFGQSRNWAISNIYNDEPITLQVGDPTPTYNITSTTFTAATAINSARIVMAIARQSPDIRFSQQVQVFGGAIAAAIAVGWNSTSVGCGLFGNSGISNAGSITNNFNAVAVCQPAPFIGTGIAYLLARASTTQTVYGGSANMLMTVRFRG